MALLCSKKLSALLRVKKAKNNGNFYCLNCLILLKQTKNVIQIKKSIRK